MHRNPSSKLQSTNFSSTTEAVTVLSRLDQSVGLDPNVTPKGKTNVSVCEPTESVCETEPVNLACGCERKCVYVCVGGGEAVGVWSHVCEDNQFKHNQKVKRD